MLKKIGLSVLGVPALLLGLAAHPAQARSHFYVQFGGGYPVYSSPYGAYEYYGYPYPYTPYYTPGYVYTYPRDYYWVGRHGHMHHREWHHDRDDDWR